VVAANAVVVAVDAVVAAGEVAADVSAAAGPSTAPAMAPVPTANGSQIAIKVGFRLGTLRLPVPFTRWFIVGWLGTKTKENENISPGIVFRILAFYVIIIFEQVNRRSLAVNE
jgi:hypothetical protein